jgi:hypothetical protein
MSNLNIKIEVSNCGGTTMTDFEAVFDEYKKNAMSCPVSPMLHILGLTLDLHICRIAKTILISPKTKLSVQCMSCQA